MNPTGRVERAIGAWIDLMMRHALVVVLFGVVITGLGGVYALTHLSMDTDDSNLISAQVPWRQTSIAYQKAFPIYTDNLVVVIDGRTPDRAGQAVKRLAPAMRGQPMLFPDVYVPGGGTFFARNGLLYLKPDKLSALADRLARIQPLLGRLSASPTLPTFFDLLDKAMAPDASADFDLAPVFNELTGVFNASRAGHFDQMSWQRLMGGDQPGVSTQRFIIVKPALDYNALLPAARSMQRIRALAEQHNLNSAHGVRVRLTGETALSDDALAAVTHGASWGAMLALLAVGIILYWGLRSWRLMGAALLTLLAGLVGTATFAALTVERLNLISIAFAVLYIGLGIDYAIHVCLRYREVMRQGRPAGAALRLACTDVGISLLLCAITTAAGFFAFIPTSYSGVAELGLISGAGMFISLVVSLTFLPAAIALLGPRKATRVTATRRRAPFIGVRAQRAIWVASLLVAAGCGATLPYLHFNSDTLDLNNPNAESVKTYHDLLANSKNSPLTLVTTRPTLARAKNLAARIADRPHVSRAMTAADYVPAHQDKKLSTIGNMALTMALSAPDMSQHATPAARTRTIMNFRRALTRYEEDGHAGDDHAAVRLGNALSAWQSWYRKQPHKARVSIGAGLHDSILSGFAPQVHALMTSLNAHRITLANLPQAIRMRWIGRDGSYRVQVSPAGNLDELSATRAFVNSVQQVAPHITGAPVLQLSAGRTVSHAFVQAFIYAGVFITLFLLVLLRSLTDTLRVLAPLVLSGLILSAATVWLGIPFNFANVIALPLLLGVGVDSGIHVVHRLRGRRNRRDAHQSGPFLATSTARAVVLSSLTTMAGFGSLAFSRHAGTASLGQLLTIGMVAILLATLIVVPALFRADALHSRSEDAE